MKQLSRQKAKRVFWAGFAVTVCAMAGACAFPAAGAVLWPVGVIGLAAELTVFRCPECGAQTRLEDKFCPKCEAKLEEEP